MKKVALLLSVLAFSLNAFGASIPAEVPAKVLETKIVQLLDQPSISIYKETKVLVKFMITEDGKMDVIETTSKNKELAQYVKTRLDDQNLAVYVAKSTQVYSVSLRFIA